MIDKYKKLLKNTGVLTLGQFSSKLLVLILIPLYTSILTTEEYGIYDLLYTTVSFLYPIVTLNISVSAQRFLMDKNADIETITRISAKYACIGLIIPLVIIVINQFFKVSQSLSRYGIQFLLLFFAIEFSCLLVDYAVGLERIKDIAVSGVVSTVITLVMNVIMLIVFKLRLNGYFIANISGPVFQACYLFCVLKVWNKLAGKRNSNRKTEREMLAFCTPQIANATSWWINNTADRYIITWFCGVAVNGIYSVAYKIPSIINILSGVFGQAWAVSVVKNYDSEDKDNFISKTYTLYNAIMVLACSGLILCTRLIARFLFAHEFYNAWIYVPLLLIASMFGALSGYLGGIFSAEKESKLFARSTVIGAIVNIILNFILIYGAGAIGAALATMISYILVWEIRCFHVCRYIQFQINFRTDVISYSILLLQSFLLIYFPETAIVYFLEFILLILLLLNNRKSILLVKKRLFNIILKEPNIRQTKL